MYMYKVYNVVSIHVIWSIKLQITQPHSSEVIHVHTLLDMPHVCGCRLYNHVHICDMYMYMYVHCTQTVMYIELSMFYLVTGVMI